MVVQGGQTVIQGGQTVVQGGQTGVQPEMFEVGQPVVQGGHTVVQGGQPFVHSRVSSTVFQCPLQIYQDISASFLHQFHFRYH